jgi:hypothetical protein
MAMPGFHTVVLSSPVPVSAGTRFSVVVKVNAPGSYYPIPCERPISGYSSKATASAGQSYVSSDGSSWTDVSTMYTNTNVCVKAYAKPSTAPAALSGLSVSPASVLGGGHATGTITLDKAADAAGFVVQLSSSSSAASVPSSVTVAAGSASATFDIATSPVGQDTAVSIAATSGSASLRAGLTVVAPVPIGLAFAPAGVKGGSSSTGTVTLSGPAPAGGLVIALSSNASAASVPASVTAPAGAVSADFTVSTSPVSQDTTASITAAAGTGSQSANLTIAAPVLSALSLSAYKVIGPTTVYATVTLDSVAPAGGIVVALASSDPGTGQPPPSVTVLSGATSASFAIPVARARVTTAVTITATAGNVVKTATFVVSASGGAPRR